MSDKIGLVASINYISYGATWTTTDPNTGAKYSNNLSYSSVSVLARINIHFGTTSSLDPYWGIGAGYRSGLWSLTSDDPNLQNDKAHGLSPFGFETTLGLRYFFTSDFGIYTEIGIAKSVIQAGLVYKL